MSLSEIERAFAVESFTAAGPDAPTLCSGWRSRHLLAHLVLRDQKPLAIARDVIARKPPGEEPVLGRVAEEASTPEGYLALAERFSAGPSRVNPVAWLGDRANLVEYVVHHEDLRRGAGLGPAPARSAETLDALWRNLQPMARMIMRRSPVGVVLVVPGGPRAVVRRGPDTVAIVGDPVELALYLLGRTKAADVRFEGVAETVARLRMAHEKTD
ncbi:TIGR03085 family metal-binding protein [Georgenia faecalis]|uniref:TIGR03085 family metal-binding protein n=1 Tax=Georgenia faecalis TaxID=2483799 RepID=A0ABV9DAB6_9MICO|nr:TIGR03085 family metal-binding protein [Georgenia faecalis]